MELRPDKVLVVEANSELREHTAKVLSDAGYEVSADFAVTPKTVITWAPDVIVLGGNPPQLDCCDLLADVKASEQTRFIRVIMLASGGAGERIRGLDLGADDVLSIPFDDRELLARVRAQLREKHPEDELRETVRNERTSHREARRVIRALNQGRRTLVIGLASLVAIAVLGSGVFGLLYWRGQRQNLRVYTALARLQTGMASEQQMMELARKARTQAVQSAVDSTEAQRQDLKRQSTEIRAKLASAAPSEAGDLQKQLKTANERLQRLESESTVAQDVIRSYSSSVCLLHVTVGFRDKGSGLTLRYTSMNPTQQDGQVQVGGIGPEVRMDGFGTGFLASSGHIVTNHHVVEPWWKNDEVGDLLKQAPDIEPFVVDMTAYFPGISHGVPVSVQKISSDADLAVVAGNLSGLNLKLLSLDDSPAAAVSGQPVVLIGYPTGVDAILARTGDDALRSIAANTSDANSLMTELARRDLIRPINTQGHIGDVLTDKIIYDAQTTNGGSGGPLFNASGKVIAVNVAMLRDFGGSNFAIPVKFAKPLLPR